MSRLRVATQLQTQMMRNKERRRGQMRGKERTEEERSESEGAAPERSGQEGADRSGEEMGGQLANASSRVQREQRERRAQPRRTRGSSLELQKSESIIFITS